jgi:hypothetical protein
VWIQGITNDRTGSMREARLLRGKIADSQS